MQFKKACKALVKEFLTNRIGAIGDITVLQEASAQGGRGSRRFLVMTTATIILPGEPVVMVAGASSVVKGATGLIALTTPYVPFGTAGTGLVGVAETTSNNTATAQGEVFVIPTNSQTVWLINATTGSLINTQAKYDALVGDRITIEFVGAAGVGTYTAALDDSPLNGAVVAPLDIVRYPGKVAFVWKDSVSVFN